MSGTRPVTIWWGVFQSMTLEGQQLQMCAAVHTASTQKLKDKPAVRSIALAAPTTVQSNPSLWTRKHHLYPLPSSYHFLLPSSPSATFPLHFHTPLLTFHDRLLNISLDIHRAHFILGYSESHGNLGLDRYFTLSVLHVPFILYSMIFTSSVPSFCSLSCDFTSGPRF